MREALKRGLESVIRRKRLMDELAKYYDEHFRDDGDRDRTPDGERREGKS